jgi:hypothetical protein
MDNKVEGIRLARLATYNIKNEFAAKVYDLAEDAADAISKDRDQPTSAPGFARAIVQRIETWVTLDVKSEALWLDGLLQEPGL